jgi:hypothetical protein
MKYFWASLLAALLFAGCATLSGGGGAIDEVHLFGLPVTVNLDGIPGADGFAVRVYANKNGDAKGATINAGILEVLMFDGIVRTDDLMANQPTQSWKFGPKQLANFKDKTSLGMSYRFALRWQKAPTRGHITVVARYVSAKGELVYSAPSTISSASK